MNRIRLAPLAALLLAGCNVWQFATSDQQVEAGATAHVDLSARFEIDSSSSNRAGRGLACIALPPDWARPSATYSDDAPQAGMYDETASMLMAGRKPVEDAVWHCFLTATTNVPRGRHTMRARFALEVPADVRGVVRLRTATGFIEQNNSMSVLTETPLRLHVGAPPADTFDHWTLQHLFGSNSVGQIRQVQSLRSGAGRFVGVEGFSLIHSTDGVVWHQSPPEEGLRQVAFGNGVWVALSNRLSTLAFGDGAEVTVNECVVLPHSVSDVTYAHGRFVAIGGGSALVSENGCEWTSHPIGSASPSLVGADDEGFVAFGGTTVAHSADGVTWTVTANALPDTVRHVAHGNGRWLAVLASSDWNGTVVQSVDGGRFWTTVRSWPATGQYQPQSLLAFVDGRFITTSPAKNGTLLVGSGASGWTELETGRSDWPTSFAQNDALVVAGATESLLAAQRRAPVAPRLATDSLPGATQGHPWTGILAAKGGAGLVTLSIAAGALPDGVAFEQDVFTGTPTQTGRYTVTVRATDADARSSERELTIDVVEPPRLDGGDLGIVGANASFERRLTIHGGVPPFMIQVSVPPHWGSGGRYDSHEFLVRPSTREAGEQEIEVRVTDANGAEASATYTVTVLEDAPSLRGRSTVTVVRGRPYSGEWTAAGLHGPLTWGWEGDLPAGLSFQVQENGSLQMGGTTNAPAGRYRPTLTLTDTRGVTVYAWPTVDVVQPPVLSADHLPPAVLGERYEAELRASGAGEWFSWFVTGDLPAGLERIVPPANSSTFTPLRLTGTPTETGSFPQQVRVVDTSGIETQFELPFVVGTRPVPQPPSPVPLAVTGRAYALELGTEGKAPFTFAASDELPQGLTLTQDDDKALIGGVLMQAGVIELTGLTVTDADGLSAAFDPIEVTVVDPPQIEASMPLAIEGEAYEAIVSATSGLAPYRWIYGDSETPWMTLKELPDGTLKLSGTPTEPGTHAFGAVTVIDSNDVATTATLTVTVIGALQVTTDALAQAVAGREYRTELGAAGGLEPYTWSYDGALPEGLTLTQDGDVFVLSGTPATAGSYTLADVTVSDLSGQTARATLELTVAEAPEEPEEPETPEEPGKPAEPGKGGCGGCDAAGASGLVALMGLAALRRRRA